MIEDRLKRLNLRVDVLFPKEEFPLGKVVNFFQFSCIQLSKYTTFF